MPHNISEDLEMDHLLKMTTIMINRIKNKLLHENQNIHC